VHFIARPEASSSSFLHMGETDAWLAIRQDCFVTTLAYSPTEGAAHRASPTRANGPS